jgi:FlaA1/EpsC-like NDP-sugar epimerase
MTILTPTRAARRGSNLAWRVVTGAYKHGPVFVLECGVFWVTLVAFEFLADGQIEPRRTLALGLLLVTLAMGAGEARFRLYRRVWKVAGLNDALAAGFAAVEASVLLFCANAFVPALSRPFHDVIPLLAMPAVAATIMFVRLIPRLGSSAPKAENRLLLVVGDSRGYATVKAIAEQTNTMWTPVAIVSIAPADVHRTVMGIPVVGNVDDLEHWVSATRADGVAFVLDGKDSSDLKPYYAACLAAELPILIVPAAEDWLYRGPDRVRQLTADDLVGRRPQPVDFELAAEHIVDRTVLITGAAGSIGAELSRLVVKLRPQRLVLVDNNESGLFDITEELRATTDADLRPALVSIVDADSLLALFADERPDIVFHAAAYKHVPMLEDHPDQAFRVNVLGTLHALRSAEAVGTTSFILVSTDKAVARHSVMGCTKRLCELIVLTHRGDTACWAVRFGNVVGSRGSVMPIFERQIQQGGPVTITHPDMTRYMMTIREAVALVITSVALAKPGHLYMLDMGLPIKILDLARALIRSRGLRPGTDIEITFTGLRPGERMTEDLLGPDEGIRPTDHPSILELVSPAAVTGADLDWTIERMKELSAERRVDELVRLLKQTVAAPRRTREAPEEPTPRKRGVALEGSELG